MSELRVACAAEGREYVAHCAAMMRSVLARRGELPVRFHFLHSPRFERRWGELLRAMVEREGGALSLHEIPDSRVAGLPASAQFTQAMWFRVFLPELLPDAARVLYLDADTLAADSLEPLWRVELGHAWLGAVTNVFQHNHLHRPAQLGLPGPEVYFNSGVLLMNLEQMRIDRRTEALCEYARSQGAALEWPDQDALNVVLGERRVPLHPRWNAMNSVLTFPHAAKVFGADAVEEARLRPGIRHFEGPDQNKPWHRDCSHELRELYFVHRGGTPWPDVALHAVSA
jgi:lipopolysaccharide biosynthesis glycosyltransferase